MILTDREIVMALRSGQLIIDPLPAIDDISSTSVDLTLADKGLFWDVPSPLTVELQSGFKISSIAKMQKEIDINLFALQPKSFLLGWAREKIALPVESRLAARVEGKSSIARLGIGIHLTAPTIHSGFGPKEIQLEIFNYGNLSVRLHPGLKICQLIIEQTFGTPDKGYAGQFRP
jgi:dCTP deaminase